MQKRQPTDKGSPQELTKGGPSRQTPLYTQIKSTGARPVRAGLVNHHHLLLDRSGTSTSYSSRLVRRRPSLHFSAPPSLALSLLHARTHALFYLFQTVPAWLLCLIYYQLMIHRSVQISRQCELAGASTHTHECVKIVDPLSMKGYFF